MRGRFDSQGRPLTGGFGGRSGLNEGTPTPPQGPPSQAPTQAQTPAGFPTPGSSRPLPTQAPPPSAPPAAAPVLPRTPPITPPVAPPTSQPVVPTARNGPKPEDQHVDLSAKMVSLLTQIRNLLELQIPQGIMLAQPITVPPGQITHVVYPAPLFYLAITNDGTGAIQFRFPDTASSQWYTLNASEVVSFSYPTPVLIRIGFQVGAGVKTTPSVRTLGSY